MGSSLHIFVFSAEHIQYMYFGVQGMHCLQYFKYGAVTVMSLSLSLSLSLFLSLISFPTPQAVCTRCRVQVDIKLPSGHPVICCKVCSEEQEVCVCVCVYVRSLLCLFMVLLAIVIVYTWHASKPPFCLHVSSIFHGCGFSQYERE